MAEATLAPTDPPPAGPPEDWLVSQNGRRYVRSPRGGIVWARDGEAPREAYARSQRGQADRPPRAARGKGRGDPPPPADELARARATITARIQSMLSDLLRAPAMVCAMRGDAWGADHFTVQGERYATALATASETNPWLRAKFEAALEGEQTAVALISAITLAGATIAYLAPPLIVYLNLGVSARTRRLFNLPPGHGRAYRADEGEPPPYAEPELPDPAEVAGMAAAMFEAAQSAEADAPAPL